MSTTPPRAEIPPSLALFGLNRPRVRIGVPSETKTSGFRTAHMLARMEEPPPGIEIRPLFGRQVTGRFFRPIRAVRTPAVKRPRTAATRLPAPIMHESPRNGPDRQFLLRGPQAC